MKTWSVADVIDRATIAFVDAASLGAVVVQGIIDALTNQPNPNSHPIPGCPDAVECRTHGCAGDCSESMEHEEECSDPRLNDGLTPFDPQWKMTVADGSPPCTCPCINCCNQAHWMCHGEGVEIDTVHDDAVSCPCGGTCPPECDRDALACVQIWGPASDHAEALRRNEETVSEPSFRRCDQCRRVLGESAAVSPVVDGMFCSNVCCQRAEVRHLVHLAHRPQTSQPASAGVAENSPAGVSADAVRLAASSPPAGCPKDPSPTGDEGPAGDSAIPPEPPAGRQFPPPARDCDCGHQASAHYGIGSSGTYTRLYCTRCEDCERFTESAHPEDAVAEWVGGAVLAIRDVLARHQPHPCIGASDLMNCGTHAGYYTGQEAWQKHVALLIAEALAPQPK